MLVPSLLLPSGQFICWCYLLINLFTTDGLSEMFGDSYSWKDQKELGELSYNNIPISCEVISLGLRLIIAQHPLRTIPIYRAIIPVSLLVLLD